MGLSKSGGTCFFQLCVWWNDNPKNAQNIDLNLLRLQSHEIFCVRLFLQKWNIFLFSVRINESRIWSSALGLSQKKGAADWKEWEFLFANIHYPTIHQKGGLSPGLNQNWSYNLINDSGIPLLSSGLLLQRLIVAFKKSCLWLCTLGFMNFSDMYATPFFPGILQGELKFQVSSSYDIGKWWGQP